MASPLTLAVETTIAAWSGVRKEDGCNGSSCDSNREVNHSLTSHDGCGEANHDLASQRSLRSQQTCGGPCFLFGISQQGEGMERLFRPMLGGQKKA